MDVVDNRTFMYAKQVNLSNLLTRTHLVPKPEQKHWIAFRGHSRSNILG